MFVVVNEIPMNIKYMNKYEYAQYIWYYFLIIIRLIIRYDRQKCPRRARIINLYHKVAYYTHVDMKHINNNI